MENAVKFIKCEPQPELMSGGAWLYDGRVFSSQDMADHLYFDVYDMADHLYFDVYSEYKGNTGNRIGQQDNYNVTAVLINGVWHWRIERLPNMADLAVTIPATQVKNAGEPVFPVLRDYIRRYTDKRNQGMMSALVDRREQYGIEKYGQPLMSDDGRDTPTEITNELLDALAYLTKWAMQNPGNTLIENLLRFSVASVSSTIETIVRESEDRP